MRLFILAGLAAGAIAVFAPEQGSGLMRSVAPGFGWGFGREIAHNIFGHRHWCRRRRRVRHRDKNSCHPGRVSIDRGPLGGCRRPSPLRAGQTLVLAHVQPIQRYH